MTKAKTDSVKISENNIKILFELVGSGVCGKALQAGVRDAVSQEIISELLRTAGFHDIDHIVALGLKENGLITESNSGVERIIFKAIYRYQQLNFEYKRLCDALEASKIPFIPLKGSVLRKYYREPWMRTSCDIDVLVKRENLDYAVKYLTENLKYEEGERATHDVSLFSPTGIHIELHFDLVEEGRAQNAIGVLSTVWDDVSLAEGFEYRYEMSDEFFYFYHIAHMAKHFEIGGCGIRPFIDLWILDNMQGAALEKRNEILVKGGLFKFAESVRKLSRVWFENEAHDLISEDLENYIMRGGVYGNAENRIMVQQQKKGGRIRYALSRIFIPYSEIKFHYPILQKHPWLMPFMQVRRWCKLIFCGHLGRVTNELHYSNNISDAEAKAMQKFLENIGL